MIRLQHSDRLMLGTRGGVQLFAPALPLDYEVPAWGSPVNGTIAPSSVFTKNAGADSTWNAGAATTKALQSGNGYGRWKLLTAVKEVTCGLSKGNADADYTGIQYGIFLDSIARIGIMRSGALTFTAETYATGDEFEVRIVGANVEYYLRRAGVYTLLATDVGVISGGSYPLLMDCSVFRTGTSIVGVALGGNWA